MSLGASRSRAGVLGRGARPRGPVGTRILVGTVCLITAFAAVVVLSVGVGASPVPPSHVLSVLLSPLGVEVGAHTRGEELVLTQIRLPRIAVGSLVGAALAVSGAAMQALFRNPLADPGTTGVAAGGAVGAIVAIVTGLHGHFLLALPLLAFAGALAAAVAVYGVAAAGGRVGMATLLLAGIAVNALLGAVITAMTVLAPDEQTLRGVTFWLAGGLNARAWEHVWLGAPFVLAGLAVLLAHGRDLNLLMLGDDEARALGTRVEVARPLLLTSAALMTGAAVAVSGTIAFVGLVIPNLLRLVLGPDNRVLLPLSALGGSVFLVLADTLARTVGRPAELPVGVVTSVVGAPCFLLLLASTKRRSEAL